MSLLRIIVSIVLILGGLQIFFSQGLSVVQIIILGIELVIGVVSLVFELKSQ